MEKVPVWEALEGRGYPLFWGVPPCFYRCARLIENFTRIKMVVARASGMDLASSLKRNTFWTLGVRPVGRGPCPVGRGPRGTGGHAGVPGRGDTRGPSAVRSVGGCTPL